MHILWSLGEEWISAIFGASSRLYPIYILSLLVIGLTIYAKRRPEMSFFAWMFPKEIYAHPSHRTDIKLFFLGGLLEVGGVLKVTFITTMIIHLTLETFGRTVATVTPLTPFIVGFIFLIVSDFCTYWIHRIHHEWKLIWPFHAVHHSAEVMTPVTTYRKHPAYDWLSKIFRAVVIGVVHGLILSFLVGKVSIFLIAGTSGFYFMFNLLGSNLRHSHIWLSYGRILEHIFISPAQHQIHHSLAYKHWHKNYGEIFAIWDWMFGTLYVPETTEALAFGLSDINGRRIEQPHPNLTEALCKPFYESWAKFSEGPEIVPDPEALGPNPQ